MTRIALGFVLVLTACINNGGDPPPPPHDEVIVPLAGSWGYTDTPVSSTCPSDVRTEEAGQFAIDQVSAAGFRIIPNDGTEPFTCSLSGDNFFNCPDRVKDVEDLRPDLDAVITVHASASGTFTASGAGNGSQNANASCAGTDCDAAGPDVFPCSASVNFTIRAL